MSCLRHWPIVVAVWTWPLAAVSAPWGMAGCGPGSTIFSPSSGTFGMTCASTTNEDSTTSSTMGSALSSGTSNCIEPHQAAAAAAQREFISQNFSTLAKEMAQGDGETLRAFADTFGCKRSIYPDFAAQMQKSYEQIFAAPGSMAALEVIADEIKASQPLAAGCPRVI